MPSNKFLMAAHVEALFTHDAAASLRRVNEPWADEQSASPAPRFFLGRTSEGHIWRFRHDVLPSLVSQLAALCRSEPTAPPVKKMPQNQASIERLLAADQPIQSIWAGPAYYLANPPQPAHPLIRITKANAEILAGGFSELQDELQTAQPFVGLLAGGEVVAICRSVRIAAKGHEAGVETLPAYRNRGYATAVTAGWTQAVQTLGRLPLYSTSWANLASQALAKKAGGIQYGVDFHIT